MTTPTVASQPPALAGHLCAGYGHHSHLVEDRVYRVRGCAVWLCWECLLLLISEINAPRPRAALNHRNRFLRRRVQR